MASYRLTALTRSPTGLPATRPPSTSPRWSRRLALHGRDRLLRQPGGLAGFSGVGVQLHPYRAAIAKRPELTEHHLHLRASVLRGRPLADACDHPIPDVVDRLE